MRGQRIRMGLCAVFFIILAAFPAFGARRKYVTTVSLDIQAEIEPDSLNAMGSVHGGLMFVMAEVAAGLATRNDGRRYVTLDSSFRFIKGSNSAKTLLAEAVITKRGRTVCFARASVREPGSGILLAEGDFTFYCLDAS